MGFEQIGSLTGKFLLNRYVLDLICPSNCQKTKIAQTGNSVIHTFSECIGQFSTAKMKTGYFHHITKPVEAVLRVSFVGITFLIVSPVGVLFNGTLMTGHFYIIMLRNLEKIIMN
jgi:hypothetical protein